MSHLLRQALISAPPICNKPTTRAAMAGSGTSRYPCIQSMRTFFQHVWRCASAEETACEVWLVLQTSSMVSGHLVLSKAKRATEPVLFAPHFFGLPRAQSAERPKSSMSADAVEIRFPSSAPASALGSASQKRSSSPSSRSEGGSLFLLLGRHVSKRLAFKTSSGLP